MKQQRTNIDSSGVCDTRKKSFSESKAEQWWKKFLQKRLTS
jgi:hypothetical protein